MWRTGRTEMLFQCMREALEFYVHSTSTLYWCPVQRAVQHTPISVSFYPVAKIQFCIVETKLNFHQEHLKLFLKNTKPEVPSRDLWWQIIQNVVADRTNDPEVRERSNQRSATETSDSSKTESLERLETIHVLNALYFPRFIFSSSEQYAAEYH